MTLLLLLLLIEGLPRLLWGEPPSYDMMVRVFEVQLVVADGRAGLSAESPGAASPTVPVAHGARPRVVVLGGSSVVEPGPRAFPNQLADLAPDLEIINLGAHGIAAANLIVLASQIDVLKPDLVVVYTGHNDYSQDVFRGAIAGTRLWMVPWYRLASRSWLHSWLAVRVRGSPQRMDPSPHAGHAGSHGPRGAGSGRCPLRARPGRDPRL
ncbi:MAG: hypothetical protein GXP62_03085 [Oligoflexia bacterium]|nr:hypothetical protein [Oligoflexia bacterium]